MLRVVDRDWAVPLAVVVTALLIGAPPPGSVGTHPAAPKGDAPPLATAPRSALGTPIGPAMGPGGAVSWESGFFRTTYIHWLLPGLTYDAADGYVVAFGGVGGGPGEQEVGTWTFAHGNWTNWTGISAPSPREEAALVYDSTSARVILVGGMGGCSRSGCTTVYNDTWAFRNGNWSYLGAPLPGTTDVGSGVADDPADGGVIRFGGIADTGIIDNRTLLFSNGTWVQLSAPVAPSPRIYPGMSYDPGLGGVLLFGGFAINGTGSPVLLNDTWLFSHGAWTELSNRSAIPSASGPYGGRYDAVAYDPLLGTDVLVNPNHNASNVTYLWNGTAWASGAGIGVLPPSGFQNLVWDAADAYLLDVPLPILNIAAACYELDASGSWGIAANNTFPPARWHEQLAFDPGSGTTVLFGGFNGTAQLGDAWRLESGGWTPFASTTVPPARSGGGFAYDANASGIVLFGGVGAGGNAPNDTWTLRGSVWNRSAVGPSPPRERFGCLASDPADGGVVLFGGFDDLGRPMNETWIYGSGGWRSIASGTGTPSPRGFSACAWDPTEGSVILFGGATGDTSDQPSGSTLNDSYRFHGAWSRLAPAGASPAARADASFAPWGTNGSYGLLLYGGWSGTGLLPDLWSFNGSGWTSVTASGTPGVYEGASAVFDGTLNCWISEGGGFSIFGSGRPTHVVAYWSAVDALSAQLRSSAPDPAQPDLVKFTARAEGGVHGYRYDWSFGDGGAGTGASPTHKYTSAGHYTVTVRVTDWFGVNATAQQTLDLSGPTAPFAIAPTVSPVGGMAPLVVAYSVTWTDSVLPVTVGWKFGTGDDSSLARGTYTYPTPGNYTIALAVTDSAGHQRFQNWTISVNGTSTGTGGHPGSSSRNPISPGSGLFWILLAVLVAAVALIAGVYLRRRRPPSSPGPGTSGAAAAPDPPWSEDDVGASPPEPSPVDPEGGD